MNKKFNTVIEKFIPSNAIDFSVLNEQQIENKFIQLLEEQGYEYLKKVNNFSLLAENLKKQLERLNRETLIKRLNRDYFVNEEWEQIKSFLKINKKIEIEDSVDFDYNKIIEKTRIFRNEKLFTIKDSNNRDINLILFDSNNLEKNKLQVINQYIFKIFKNNENKTKRFDVTVLINGLPLVHLELKRERRSIKEAFEDIEMYQKEAFFADPLFQFVHVFVISKLSQTRYFANTALKLCYDPKKLRERNGREQVPFEKTSCWSDQNNTPINDLFDFAKTFLKPSSILNIVDKYCVLRQDKKNENANQTDASLLVLRPYQIAAIEKMLNKTISAIDNNSFDTRDSVSAGGYIWHSTGSGKTLTSFVATQLLNKLRGIDHVLFVVDRNDLDIQTVKEYTRVANEEGARFKSVDSTDNTKALEEKLFKSNSKNVVITTIQKLYNLLNSNNQNLSKLDDKKFVIVFDECHRSSLGKMLIKIKQKIKNRVLFGFTGTPIFIRKKDSDKTTEDVFGKELHKYNLLNAIEDENVLGFVYKELFVNKETQENKNFLNSIERKKAIVKTILKEFNKLTTRKLWKDENIDILREKGFNALFAVRGRKEAIEYYNLFKNAQANLDKNKKLNITTIFSCNAKDTINTDNTDLDCDSYENPNNTAEGIESREFFTAVINDYKEMFGGKYSVEDISGFFTNVAERIVNRELDLVIVARMLLTGFDAEGLNTLFVDIDMENHGLIQAFSRTNRVFTPSKKHGMICSFRPLKENLDNALKQYASGKSRKGVSVVVDPDFYYHQLLERIKIFKEKTNNFTLRIDKNNEELMKLFKDIRSLWQKCITTFFEFDEKVKNADKEMYSFSYQKYLKYDEIYSGIIKDIREEYKTERGKEKYSWAFDFVFDYFEVDINIDYIKRKINEANTKEEQEEIARQIIGKFDRNLRKIDLFLNEIGKKETNDKFKKNYGAVLEYTHDFIKEEGNNNNKLLIDDFVANVKENTLSYDKEIENFAKTNFLDLKKFKHYLLNCQKFGHVVINSQFQGLFLDKTKYPLKTDLRNLFKKKLDEHFDIVKPYLKNIVDNDRVSAWI
ncbi:MAG: HsdR family type I site-specific deoxyribonuclease [Mycoplasma sp.]